MPRGRACRRPGAWRGAAGGLHGDGADRLPHAKGGRDPARRLSGGVGGSGRAVEEPAVARAVAAAIGTSQPFFLPYQGENDREPQAAYGRLACRLLAETEPVPPPAARPT